MVQRTTKRPKQATDDEHPLGIEPIDATPEDIARAMFAPNDRRVRAAAKARRKQTTNK